MSANPRTTSADAQRSVVLEQHLADVIVTATRAPSLHNSQPWRFRQLGSVVQLLADRQRQLTSADPDGRELTLACGAALYNLRVAVARLGFEPVVVLLPDPADPDLLATVELGGRRTVTAEDDVLYEAVMRRHTHREPFSDTPVPRALLVRMQEAVRAEGALLHLIEHPGHRLAVSQLVINADRQQRRTAAFRDELAAWTPPPNSRRRDGVPANSYPRQPDGPIPQDFPVRDFGAGRGWGVEVAPATGRDPTIAVLATAEDSVVDWLRAGQALERALLLATTEWVFASYFSAAVELAHVRSLLRTELTLPGPPQMVLRLGFAGFLRVTPRRPVKDVILAGNDRTMAREAPAQGS